MRKPGNRCRRLGVRAIRVGLRTVGRHGIEREPRPHPLPVSVPALNLAPASGHPVHEAAQL
ncbi:hypothetical protein DWA04_21350, partial [Acinetobacter baumannii]